VSRVPASEPLAILERESTGGRVQGSGFSRDLLTR
jgi:hypothetical protein